MPTAISMKHVHPFFRVRERHPLLHGLAWVAFTVLLVMAFVLSVMSGVWSMPAGLEGAAPALPLAP